MNNVSSQTTQLDYRMRPAEKLEIAENLVKHILAKVEYFVDECEHTAKRAKRFPFFMKREYSTPYGKWLCVLTFFEKWTTRTRSTSTTTSPHIRQCMRLSIRILHTATRRFIIHHHA